MKTITLDAIQKAIGHPTRIVTLSNNSQIIHYPNGSLFFSYGQIIGAEFFGVLAFTKLHDYSKTTSKYCKEWCGLDKKQRCKLLENEFAYLIE